jgi:NAD(P)-dependent dehydrogenase (short-subunit alcohol dehydrogenase family)
VWQWVKDLLKQDNTVIGTARDPDAAAAFKVLSEQYRDKFVPTALDASLPDSITAWADQLKSKVTHIDVSGAACSVTQQQSI